MRWQAQWKRRRVRESFLWFPKRIGREWRWLEVGRWAEEWLDEYGWNAMKWVDRAAEVERLKGGEGR